jgi:hypothetical protein
MTDKTPDQITKEQEAAAKLVSDIIRGLTTAAIILFAFWIFDTTGKAADEAQKSLYEISDCLNGDKYSCDKMDREAQAATEARRIARQSVYGQAPE